MFPICLASEMEMSLNRNKTGLKTTPVAATNGEKSPDGTGGFTTESQRNSEQQTEPAEHAADSSKTRQRSHTVGDDYSPPLDASHRSMTVIKRQESRQSSVKDFLRGKNHQLEKAIGACSWKHSAEQEKWNQRRLRMTQRCGMKLRSGDSLVCATSSSPQDFRVRDLSVDARAARGDFLDGGEGRSSVQPRSLRESHFDAARYPSTISTDAGALPKKSVLQLTMKGLRRAMGGASSVTRNQRRQTYDTTPVSSEARLLPGVGGMLPSSRQTSGRVHEIPSAFNQQRRMLHVMLPTTSSPFEIDKLAEKQKVSKFFETFQPNFRLHAPDETFSAYARFATAQQSKLPISKTWSLEERHKPHTLPEVAKAPIVPDEKLPTPRFRRAADDSTAAMQKLLVTDDDAGQIRPEIQFDFSPDIPDEKRRPHVADDDDEGEDVGDGIKRRISVVDFASQLPDSLLEPRPSLLPDMLGRTDYAPSATFIPGSKHQRPQAKNLPTWEDHRPYFTYWVTTAQILVTCFGLFIYGFGPFGLQKAERTQMVMTIALALEAVDFYEPSSFWLGPRAQHLVHLGAKYTPCMRSERQIKREMQQLRDQERKSACCVRNDGAGCVQATEDACSPSISRWLRWPDAVGAIGGWSGGSVCGLDPRYCHDPSPSVALLTWNHSDITTWPKCDHNHANAELAMTPDHYDTACRDNGAHCKGAMALAAEPHMACELLGRPCCYGIRGQCRLATREFCDFVRGYYHEDAFLCSQVSCLEQVCGMMPFLYADQPNQFYRLLTSLFIHAGLLHLILTVLVQYFYMAELEIMCGWWRMAVVYLLSGVTGNLVSAIFLPDVPEVGPSASQFALFGLLLVEVLDKWKHYESPWRLLFGVVGLVLLFIGLGTLPWIDNFAQTFGFISGLLLSAFFMPYMAFGSGNVRRLIKWLALAIFIVMFTLLVVFFYFLPLDKYDCPTCSLLNCIPFYEDFCNDQNSYFFPKGYSSFS